MRLFSLCAAVLALSAAVLLTGCGLNLGRGKTAPAKATPSPSPSPGGSQGPLVGGSPSPGGAVQNVRQAAKRAGDQNELRGIALIYNLHKQSTGKAPSRLEDIKADLQRDAPKGYAAILEDVYEIVWNVNDNSSTAVIAYAKNPDSYGTRVVALSGGSVERMNAQQFQAAMAKR